MYPPPEGQDLTEEQSLELDDTFLASDPFEYFNSRIASLLAWHENAPADADLPEPAPGSIRAEFNQYLQRPAADGPLKDLDVHAQVAAARIGAPGTHMSATQEALVGTRRSAHLSVLAAMMSA